MPVGDVVGHDVGGVAAPVQRIEKPAVEKAVEAPAGVAIGFARDAGSPGLRLTAIPTFAPGTLARTTGTAQPWDKSRWWLASSAVGQSFEARRVQPALVAEDARAPRLVVRDPVLDPIAQAPRDHLREARKGLCRRAHGPAALVLEHLRKIPVVERGVRLDPRFEQRVDEARVEVEPARLHRAAAGRQDPRPRDREAVGADSEPLHQRRRPRGTGGSGRTRRRRCCESATLPGIRAKRSQIDSPRPSS